MNAGKVNFGLLLIVIGVAASAVNLEAMHWSVFLNLLRFWPVILIAVGLQMILKRLYSPAAYLSCLLVAVVGFWILYDSYEVYGIGGEERLSSFPVSELEDGVTRVSVEVEADQADLTISSSSSELVRCYYDNPLARPIVRYETDGSIAKVFVEDRKFSRWAFFDTYETLPDWSVKLYNGLPMSLKLDCPDSDIRLRFADFRLEELECDTRYSSLDIRFGALVPEIRATMRVARSEVRIRIPDSAGVEILDADGFEGFFTGDLDFVADGGRLVTANFDSAPVKFRFDLEGTARVFRITYY